MKHIFRILRSASELKRYYLSISVLAALTSLSALLIPLLSGRAIDEIRFGAEADLGYLTMIAAGIFILDILSNFLTNTEGYLGDQMSQKLHKLLATRYYEHILSLSQRYYDKELSGKIINRLNRSITQLTSFMQTMSNWFLHFLLTTILSLALVAYYSWQIALLLFVLYPIYIWLTIKTSNVWQKYQAKKNLHLDIATGRFAEAIGQIKVVKSYLQEKTELNFFKKQMQKVVDTNKPQSSYWHIRDVRRRTLLNIIFFFVYLFIFIQAANGLYSPGVAVTIILLAQQIRAPIFSISYIVESFQKAIADSKDYFEIMNERPEISDKPGAIELNVTKGEICFDNVSFSYDSKQPVLKLVNALIKPDTKVALVGESGEGKTTLTNLLLRLYEPEKGAILIDGQDISSVTLNSLRRNIAVVFQEPALFSGTVRENIAYARPGASEENVVAAAKAANAHEFIQKFDKNYDSEIGERGLKLSGGQKQRIAIARAILKDAPILILDEATSSLDSRSEHMVQEALEHLMRGRTTLIIAHRLSTIQSVDQIITLKGGTVDEAGTPEKLAQSGGIYDQLLSLQRHQNTETVKKKLQEFEIDTTEPGN